MSSKASAAQSPEPAKVRALRLRFNITQEQAAEIVFVSRRTWQDWERGIAEMHPGLWELFKIKTKGMQPLERTRVS